MSDYSDKVANAEFKRLKEKIEQVYGDAYKEISKTIEDYFSKFESRDAEMQSRLSAGEISEDYYKQWRLNQIGRGKRFEAVRDNIAQRMTNANETATRYINDGMVNVYTESRNFAAYTIEQTGASINFALMNEEAVRQALKDGAKTMPFYDETFPMARRNLLTNKDIAWGQKQITSSVTSAIIQGKSVKEIADDLQQRITGMNRNSAIRAARTAVGAAQNAGHQAVYSRASKMGIKGTKMWDAVIDHKTRDSHRELDGVKVDVDEEFPNGLMFPRDPSGEPAEVYNCRCRILYILPEIESDFDKGHTVETYKAWKASKEESE